MKRSITAATVIDGEEGCAACRVFLVVLPTEIKDQLALLAISQQHDDNPMLFRNIAQGLGVDGLHVGRCDHRFAVDFQQDVLR